MEVPLFLFPGNSRSFPVLISESMEEIPYGEISAVAEEYRGFTETMLGEKRSRCFFAELCYLTSHMFGLGDSKKEKELQKMSRKGLIGIPVVPETRRSVELQLRKDIAAGNKFSIQTSSNGGFDIMISVKKNNEDVEISTHMPNYSSVHHPLIEMVLFAGTMYDSTLRCLKSVSAKSMVESGMIIPKPKSHSPNTLSARKDVHALADTALENHSISSGLDKNIPMPGELDYNVDLSTVPLHSGGFAMENVYNLHSLSSAPSSADHGITKSKNRTKVWQFPNIAMEEYKTEDGQSANIPKVVDNIEERFANVAKAVDKTEDWRLANIPKAVENTEDWQFANVTKAMHNTKDCGLMNIAKAEYKTEVWLMATAAVNHATGTRDLLSDFTTTEDLFVQAGDGVSMPVCGRGSVITSTVVLHDVWFVPGLTENLVSVTQLTDLDYSVGFARAACIIKSATDGVLVGKARVSENGMFEVDFLKVGPVI